MTAAAGYRRRRTQYDMAARAARALGLRRIVPMIDYLGRLHANAAVDRATVHPSQRKIARECHVTERTVRRWCHDFRHSVGAVYGPKPPEKVGERDWRRQTNSYRVDLGACQRIVAGKSPAPTYRTLEASLSPLQGVGVEGATHESGSPPPVDRPDTRERPPPPELVDLTDPSLAPTDAGRQAIAAIRAALRHR